MMNIEPYKGIPPGKVLSHTLKKKQMTQKQFASLIGVHNQTISAIITGARDIPENLSFKLDHALGYEDGFFLLLQCHYRIYLHRTNPNLGNRAVPQLRPVLFWDVDMNSLDWQKHKHFIIDRVKQRGSDEEIKRVLDYYGE